LYSPKLSEELVRNLYRIARAKKVSMAKLVNDIVADAIKDIRVEAQVIREEVSKETFVVTGEGHSPDSRRSDEGNFVFRRRKD